MKFKVRFFVGGRLGSASSYGLRDICVNLVDRYSLKEKEVTQIVQLKPGEKFKNEDMEIIRQEPTRIEIAEEQKRQQVTLGKGS